jgi:protein kinase A
MRYCYLMLHSSLHRLFVGAFGKVWLATSRDSKQPYALKTISKRQLLDAGQVKGVLREKQIMASLEHPFILPLVGSFQDDDFLYLLLPMIQGGELFNVVHTDKKDGLDNASSQFYAACILEALGYLHARNIVYRDMKVRNIIRFENPTAQAATYIKIKSDITLLYFSA